MQSEANEKSHPKRPVTEWIIGALSAVVIAGLAAFLVYEAMFADVRPPDLHVTIEDVEVSDTGTQVNVAVTNEGDRTAAKVTVRALLPDDNHEIEFDYVAGRSVQKGTFSLPGHASASDLRVEIGGYVEP